MPASPRKYPLGPQQRLALQLLADTPFGATEAAMFVNGFTRRTLVRLIRAGLATTQREIKAGQTGGRLRITEAGRRALETLYRARASLSESRSRNAEASTSVPHVAPAPALDSINRSTGASSTEADFKVPATRLLAVRR
jgi:hypothetical protein